MANAINAHNNGQLSEKDDNQMHLKEKVKLSSKFSTCSDEEIEEIEITQVCDKTPKNKVFKTTDQSENGKGSYFSNNIFSFSNT